MNSDESAAEQRSLRLCDALALTVALLFSLMATTAFWVNGLKLLGAAVLYAIANLALLRQTLNLWRPIR